MKNRPFRIRDWLLRILNGCLETLVVPKGLKEALIVPTYKGEMIKQCADDRGSVY